MLKRILAFILLTSALTSILTACGSRNNLTGTWLFEYSNDVAGESDEYKLTGNKFTRTQYTYDYEHVPTPLQSPDTPSSDGLTVIPPYSPPPPPLPRMFRIPDYDSRDAEITELGEYIEGEYIIYPYRIVTHGTYSITDDMIEFLYSDGKIDIFIFSHTDNTLTLTNPNNQIFGMPARPGIRYIKQ